MEKTVQLFENPSIAQKYSKYRPTFPKQLFDKVFTFAAKNGVKDNMAVDLACGSGQTTFDLCDRFRRTVGVDISKAQIECALEKKKAMGKGDNVEFVVCPASNMPFENESVDLMTCSEAWHYLYPETVLPEIDRVLKRPGVLAVYGCGRPVLYKQQLDNLLSHTWENVVICQGPYGNIRTTLDNHYRDVQLPYPLAERHDMQLEYPMSLEDVEGLVKSWGTYGLYCKQHPGNTILEDMMLEMKKVLLEEEEASEKITDKAELSSMTFGSGTPTFLLLTVKN